MKEDFGSFLGGLQQNRELESRCSNIAKRCSKNEINKCLKSNKSYESVSDEVLEVWRLISQSGTQEILKIIQKCFERGFGNFLRWIARKWRIRIMMF